jgi:hypothetical protein
MFWNRKISVSVPNVANFISALKIIAPAADRGSYAFIKPGGGCHGFVQFIVRSDHQLDIHRLWTLDPGKGNGSIMLTALCKLADTHGVELRLKVIPIGHKPHPMSRDQLKAWYLKCGFEGSRWKLVRVPKELSSTTDAQFAGSAMPNS